MATATEQRKPIREAAKAVHKSRAYVRGLIDKGELTAYRLGGKDDAPWLAVDVTELQRVVDRLSIYTPPAVKTNPARRRPTNRKIHPAAAAM